VIELSASEAAEVLLLGYREGDIETATPDGHSNRTVKLRQPWFTTS